MKDLWVPLSGAKAQQNYIDVLANNVANINTTAHKRDQVSFEEELNYLNNPEQDDLIPTKEWTPEQFYQTRNMESGFVHTRGTYTDFSQGQLTPTGNPLDFALEGEGFFEVLTPRGIRYTRDGHFSFNSEGEVVNARGDRLLAQSNANAAEGEDLSKRFIKLSGRKISVNNQGEISSERGPIAKMALVDFLDKNALKKEGGSYYVSSHPENKTSSLAVVHQSHLEQSNVNGVLEMSELIKAHRHFDSIYKVLKTYDQIEGKSVSEIAKF